MQFYKPLLLAIPVLLTLLSFCKENKADSYSLNSTKELSNQPNNSGLIKPLKINISDSIFLTADTSEVFKDADGNNLIIYFHLSIFVNSINVFKDTTVTEYELNRDGYPKYKKLSNGSNQILIVLNDRPNANVLIQFTITDNKLQTTDTLPFFPSAYVDTSIFLTGKMDYSESIGDDSVIYNPFLVYANTDNGIFLDSSETIKSNEENYGHFYGYQYNEEIHIERKNKHIGAK